MSNFLSDWIQNLPLSTDIATQSELDGKIENLSAALIGNGEDVASADTICGSKKYAKEYADETRPLSTSQLINDSGFVTSENVPHVELDNGDLTVDSVTAHIPDVTLENNSLTVDEATAFIPEVSLDGNNLTINGSTAYIPDVSIDGNSLTVNGNTVNVPDVTLNGHALTVNGSYVTIPEVSLDGNVLIVDSSSVAVPEVILDGSSLTVNGNTAAIPDVVLNGNSLTVNNHSVTVPEVDLNNGVLTVNSVTSFIHEVALDGNTLSVDGRSATFLTAHQDLSDYALKSTVNQLSDEVTEGLSNTVVPKLNIVADLVSAETQKLDELSGKLSSISISSISSPDKQTLLAINNNGTATIATTSLGMPFVDIGEIILEAVNGSGSGRLTGGDTFKGPFGPFSMGTYYVPTWEADPTDDSEAAGLGKWCIVISNGSTMLLWDTIAYAPIYDFDTEHPTLGEWENVESVTGSITLARSQVTDTKTIAIANDLSSSYVSLTAYQALEARVTALESRLSDVETIVDQINGTN